jgi:RNA methyltransferase, TrmH family
VHTPSITSVTNSRVKSWIALGKRSERDASGSFLVEGLRESERIGELTPILETIWCEAYAHVDAPRNAVTVSQHVFDRISRRTNPDGVAVIAKTPYLGIDTFSPSSPVLTIVADGIEKPGNIGAMLRTCDALGAAFIASQLRTDVVNPNVVRAAQGSLFATPTALVDRSTAVAWCTANSQMLVLRPGATAKVWDIDLTQPTSVVVGAEHDGVGAEWDGVGTGVSIPMVGVADSLNASISAAIVIAEANRQRSM